MFSQDVVDQSVDVAWILGWRAPLRKGVAIGFMSLCVPTLDKSLNVTNSFLRCDASFRGNIGNALLNFCLGLYVQW